MSKTALRTIPCRTCHLDVVAVTIESANPLRHPPFQEKLLDRTLLRIRCPHCQAEHLHYERFMWSDLPGRLWAVVLHESERPRWPTLEIDASRVVAGPLREEGPPAVRELGAETAIRLVFGLEELREKVLCRIHDLDDRAVEVMKEDLPAGSVLDAVAPGTSLTFTDERSVDVGWHVYEETAARAPTLAPALPGLFDPAAAWVNVARSRRAPRIEAAPH